MTRRRRQPDVPTCAGLRKWLTLNLGGPRALGALTGTDYRALNVAVHLLELRAVTSNESGLLEAFHVVVMKMQPSTRYFAYHAIAFLGDWHHRAEVWVRAGLSFDDLSRIPRCQGDRGAWSAEELDELDARRERAAR